MPVKLLDASAGDVDQLIGVVLVFAQRLARHETRRRPGAPGPIRSHARSAARNGR